MSSKTFVINSPLASFSRLRSHASRPQGSATLVVGKHVLEGKKVPVKPPFALMEKIEEPAPMCDQDEGQKAYKVIAMIRDKYVFRTRPKHTFG